MTIALVLLFARSFCEGILLLAILRMVNPNAKLNVLGSVIFAFALALDGSLTEYFQIPFHLVVSIVLSVVVFLALKRAVRKESAYFIVDILLSFVILTAVQFIITIIAGLLSVNLLEAPVAVLCILVGLVFVFAKLSSNVRIAAFFEKYYFPNRTAVLFSIISILLLMAALINMFYYHEGLLDIAGRGQIYLVSIGYFIINIWLCIALFRMRLANVEKTSMQEYGEKLTRAVDEYRMSTHDFKHHLQTMIILNRDENGMVMNKNLNAYIEYLNLDKNQEGDRPIILDDVAVSAILHQKREYAKQKGIGFHVNHFGKKLPDVIPCTELIEILNNLIENSFEAVEGLEPEARSVWLELSKSAIEIRNNVSFDIATGEGWHEHIFEKGYSTKGPNRGYGLSNVLTIAERRHIKIRHELQNGMVVIRLETPDNNPSQPEGGNPSGASGG